MRVGKKVKPNYKRPQYVGKLKATGDPKPPVKRPAKKKRTVGMLSPVLHPWV